MAPTYYDLGHFETVPPKDTHWFEAMKPRMLMLEESHKATAVL